jgi:hypothetical protein
VNCAVTYAFSLSRLGRNADALSILEHLPPDQLRDPHAAVYVALVLAEASQIEASNSYIAMADQIYPEEEQVVEEAKTRLTVVSATPAPAMSAAPADLSPAPTISPR